MARIRLIVSSDADAFLRLCLALDAESQTMMLEPGERSPSVDDQRSRIEEIHNVERSAILVAECEGQLVGFVEIEGGHIGATGTRRPWRSGSFTEAEGRESAGSSLWPPKSGLDATTSIDSS